MLYYYFALFCFGLFAGVLLFSKKAELPSVTDFSPEKTEMVSVIIPVRNEEKNIASLLNDLQHQTLPNFEVICVDDGSTDNTASIIKQYNVHYIKVNNKPSGWTGKTFACQTGAQKAVGDILIFIDADVRLKPEALAKLPIKETIVSVQPFHVVSQRFEQFAFFFNAMGLAANGVFCRFASKKAGLFGPVICISKPHFNVIGGFEKVSTSVIEDVALGKIIQSQNIPMQLYAGDKTISFKMYQTCNDLVLGFTKNFSSGATQTPLLLLLLSFLWVTALTAVPIVVLQGLLIQNRYFIALGFLFYLLFVLQLWRITAKIGTFNKIYLCVYPILLFVFHSVFLYSIYAKYIRKKVNWKGRDISLKK